MSFNYLDIILLVPLAWAAWKGFTKGFILEIFGLLALAVGIYGAIHFSDYTADWLREQFELDSDYMPVIAFSATFIGLVILVHLLGKMVEKVAHIANLKLVNKLFGALFGLLKIALVLSVIIVILESINEKASFLPKDLREDSLLYEPVYSISVWAIPAIKESELFEQGWQLRDLIPDQLKPNSD